MATKRQLKTLTADLEGLLEESNEFAAAMDEAGLADHPMTISLRWLIPQLARSVERGKQGDLALYDDDDEMAMSYTVMIVNEMCEFTLTSIDYMMEEMHQREVAAAKLNPRSRKKPPTRKM